MKLKFEYHGRPRVVITGIGALTPLGTVYEMWDALCTGTSGITRIDRLVDNHTPIKIAGEVKNFNPTDYIPKKDARRMARVSQFAVAASLMAIQNAGLTPDDVENNGERTGVVMGTTMGPHLLAEDMTTEYRFNDHKRPNPVSFANCLPNMPAHYVSRFLRTFGPLSTPSSACATGTQAIGDAAELIRSQRVDMVIAGGTEAILRDYIIAGFASMAALAEGFDECPGEASRPFDANRSGFVISEGCGALVLESMEHACKRGANIYAEIAGHANSSDAHHIAVIDPDAKGMQRAMRWALNDAKIDPSAIQYINAHGTSTESNDRLETKAIKDVFGNHAYDLAVSSNKSMMGHVMAATGAIEAIASILTLHHQKIPPTINYQNPDPECDLDYVPNITRDGLNLKYAMSNNFGLGGQNASVIFATV